MTGAELLLSFDHKRWNVVMAKGQGIVPRGRLIAMRKSNGLYYDWDTSVKEVKQVEKSVKPTFDGIETLVGILGETVDTTDADVPSYCYIIGEFNADVCSVKGDVKPERGIYNYGNIIIKKELS